jgi:chitodextrinase
LGNRLNTSLDTLPIATQAITLSVTYRNEDMLHLDPSRLTLRRWDESKKAWQALPTTVDTSQKRVTAQATAFGHFDLHAPLLCAVDGQEPDDHYGAAQAIVPGGGTVTRAFDTATDRDWLRVTMQGGEMYVVQATGLGAGVDAVVQLRNLETLALLASGRSVQETALRTGGGQGASLKWQPPRSGTYLLLVSPAAGSARGCGATYGISVARVRPLDRVAIAGPAEGTVEKGYTFKATVAPYTATQPITFSWQIAEIPQATGVQGSGDVFTFTWNTSGTYHVLIRAANPGGAVTATHTMMVYPSLRADFSASPRTGQAPLKVAFSNISTGSYTDSRWDFGDGATSSAESPSHVYEAAGVYAVTLTVTGSGGTDSRTVETYIIVDKAAAPGGYKHRIYLPLVERNG